MALRLRVASGLLLLLAASCGGTAQTAQTAQKTFVYQDLRCDAPLPDDAGAGQCHEVGDAATYLLCSADGECPPATPFCRTLGLFKGGDFNCNATVRICRSTALNDCVR